MYSTRVRGYTRAKSTDIRERGAEVKGGSLERNLGRVARAWGENKRKKSTKERNGRGGRQKKKPNRRGERKGRKGIYL